MDEQVINFIRVRQIDSFQKLRLLLLLYQRPGLVGTSQEFANQLHLGDVSLLEQIINDLQAAGLLDCIEGRYRLREGPGIKLALQHLAKSFENPVTRQQLLNLVKLRHCSPICSSV
jgi:hypothetical protein